MDCEMTEIERLLDDLRQGGDIERAEKATLELFDTDTWLKGGSDLSEALTQSLRQGNTNPVTPLMLALLDREDSQETLNWVDHSASDLNTKLRPWDPPFPFRDAVLLAKAKAGDVPARDALLGRLENAETGTLHYLLQVIAWIDDPALMHSLTRALDDQTVIGGGAPSGAEQPRRIADEAVDAFARELKFDPGFPLAPSVRYTQHQIELIKNAVKNTVPR